MRRAILWRAGRRAVDLVTGSSVALPETAGTQQLVAAPDMVVYATSRGDGTTWRLATIALRVPHDPAALQRWLREITNARPADSGVGGVWP